MFSPVTSISMAAGIAAGRQLTVTVRGRCFEDAAVVLYPDRGALELDVHVHAHRFVQADPLEIQVHETPRGGMPLHVADNRVDVAWPSMVRLTMGLSG